LYPFWRRVRRNREEGRGEKNGEREWNGMEMEIEVGR
jgi:hypothetical protein